MTHLERACSRCGGLAVFLVIGEYDPGSSGAGRVMAYCRPCRNENVDRLSTCLPLALLDRAPDRVMSVLYAVGATLSEPEMASETLFGDPLASWVADARANISQGEPSKHGG